jgi:hypothetical protein
VFLQQELLGAYPRVPCPTGLLLWNYSSEAELLRTIQTRFEADWRNQERIKILGKPTTDLFVCGVGIAKFDLAALFCRAHFHSLAEPAELYEVFLKARPIHLANEASFLFPEEPVLYPETTREMAGRLGLRERKGSSKSAWQLYESERLCCHRATDGGRVANSARHLPASPTAHHPSALSSCSPCGAR